MSQPIRPFVPIALYEGMIDALPAGVLVFRLDDAQDSRSLRLLFANPRAADIIGVDPNGDHGESLPDLLPYVYSEDLPDRMAEVARTGKAEELGDVRFDEKGTVFATSLFGLPDQSVGLMIEDVTDEREQEEVRMREVAELAEERFRTLAEALPQLVWTAFPDGTVEYYNPQWYAYTGMKPGTTKHERVLTHPDDRDRVVAAWAEAVKKGEPFQLEYRLERASDGAYRWFLGRALPLRDSNGAVTRWVGTATDIHDRKEEEALLHSALEQATAAERQVLSLVDNLPELAWTARADGTVDFLNHRWYEFTGRSPGQGDRDWLDPVSPEVRDEVSEAWQASLAAGESFVREFPLHAGDGSVRWFLTRVRPLLDAGGAVERWVGISTDIDEQRQLRTALAESEGRFRLLTDAMPQMIWTADAQGVPDYFNARWYAYTGADRAAGPARLHDYLHADDRESTLAEFARAASTATPFERECRFRGQDGGYRWFLARALPQRDAAGEVVRWFGSATDIQERKEAEAVLEAEVAARTSEARTAAERLDAVLNSTTDMIAAVDTELRVIAFNEPLNTAVKTVIGQPLRLGMTADELMVDPAQLERSEANWRRALSGESFTVVQQDDYVGIGQRAFETRYSTIRDAAGEVTGAVGVIRDVTDRHRAAAALESFAGDLRLLHAVTTAEHATIDALVEDYLRAGLSILGMDTAAFARVAPFHVRVASSAEASKFEGVAVDEHAADVILEQAGTVSVANAAEEPGRAPQLAGAFIGAPVYVAGEADGVLGFASGGIRSEFAAREVEIVEILAELVGHALTVEHAEAAIHRRTVELEQRNEELEQFAYVASHDLQEPLRTISSFLQLLEKRFGDSLDDKGREYIGFALDGSRRMQTLIQGLLAYSRVGTRGAAFEPVDAEAVMDDVLVDLGPARLESHADIRVEPLPTVCADPIQLHQLFLNLVGNAIKFRAPNSAPSITITAHRDPSRAEWRFSVADTGIGLDARHGPRVFQLFQRLHTREEYEGTGIGLALCRKIVERHGGVITYAPNEAGGTTFTFTLPDRGEDCGVAAAPAT